MFKLCIKCKINKEYSSFSKHSRTKDGLQNICKECNKLEYIRSREIGLTAMQKRRALKKEAVLEERKRYRDKNKESINEKRKEYVKNNRDKVNARKAKYRAAKLNATPKWLTKEDFNMILSFYLQAKTLSLETGIKYQVDHIVPLRGKTVCGLHVPWNLQVITAEENRKKRNLWL